MQKYLLYLFIIAFSLISANVFSMGSDATAPEPEKGYTFIINNQSNVDLFFNGFHFYGVNFLANCNSITCDEYLTYFDRKISANGGTGKITLKKFPIEKNNIFHYLIGYQGKDTLTNNNEWEYQIKENGEHFSLIPFLGDCTIKFIINNSGNIIIDNVITIIPGLLQIQDPFVHCSKGNYPNEILVENPSR